MKYWTVEYTENAKKDRKALDNSVRIQVDKAIRKVSQNPLPKNEGGYQCKQLKPCRVILSEAKDLCDHAIAPICR